jgi:HSP20 family protein
MNLTKWGGKRRDPESRELAPWSQLRTEMDRLFDGVLRQPFFGGWGEPAAGAAWTPALDLAETEKEVTLRTELPGVNAKDLDISVSGNVLTLAGEKKDESEERGTNYYHCERRFGAFRRSIQLPAVVAADSASAEYADGVLTIRLQKSPAATLKRIAIKSTGK